MRVLFTTQAIPSHFQPLVPLARAVRDAGHVAAFATGPEFKGLAESLGFEAFATGPDFTGNPEVEELLSRMTAQPGPESMAFGLPEMFVRWAGMQTLPAMEAAVDAWRPDVVVSEVSEFAGGLVAERRGLPVTAVLFGIDMPREAAVALVGEALQELRSAAGLPPDPELSFADRLLRLSFAPRSYQPPELPLSPLTHVLRPEPFDRSSEETLPAWLDELPDRPTVYATLGTVFPDTPGIFEAIIDGLAAEPVNVIVTVSRRVDPARLRGRAPNLHVEPFIPNSLLLPHCSAVVAHAGYGTVMGCLEAGVPMVLLPIAADQFLHAGRCSALGAARALDVPSLTPDAVRDAVRAVLHEPGFRDCAHALRDEIAAMPRVEHAVALLEELVRTGVPPRRD